MENRYPFSDSDNSDFKLSRAASFSNLTTSSNKVMLEQKCETDNKDSLIRQYSCEQIYDHKSNSSHLKVSETIKSGDRKEKSTWQSKPTRIPTFRGLNQGFNPFAESSRTLKTERKKPSLIAPAKLVLSDDKSVQIIPDPNFSNGNEVSKEISNESDLEFTKPLFTPKLSIKNTWKKRDAALRENSLIKRKSLNEITWDKHSSSDIKEDDKVDTSELKKRLRSLIAEEPKKKTRVWLQALIMFTAFISLVTFYSLFFLNKTDSADGFCKPTFKLSSASKELKDRLYGQDLAMRELNQYFVNIENQSSLNIVSFVGGTGVGKSYASEIIKETLGDTLHNLNFFSPLIKKESEAYSSLSACRCNFIVLENLKTDDVLDVVHFAKKLKSEAPNYCILVLAIFNIQETDNNLKRSINWERAISMIENSFKNEIDTLFKVIKFKQLTADVLKKCIEDAAVYNNIVLSIEKINYITRDLLNSDSGCKGANAKVQLFNDKMKSEL
ncbi:hypothetical protein TKK_0001144 [Trichogramma kaykai]|uniref:Uncharacterized protein n=1 Tax=Trichogramma kaykai TaxID=54128 RepID=A0ABD2WTH2_9HYME